MKIKHTIKLLIILSITIFGGLIVFNSYELFNYKFYIVSSNSMTGIIDLKSLVIVEKINIRDIEKGDIVAFKDHNLDVDIIHLVVDKNCDDNTLQTASVYPAQTLDQNPIYEEQLIGKVRWHSKALGQLFLFISNPLLLITLIIAFIIFKKNKQ